MLRVATYNVHALRDDRSALVRVVRAIRPDVLCLQEVPRLLHWRRRRRELARDVGMSVAAGGRIGGVAVFTGPAVRLLHGSGHRLRWYAGLEWRAIAVAVVAKGRARYAVCSAHLDLVAGARLRHVTQIVPILERTARRYGALPVLAGDINEQPGEPAWQYLAGRYRDCFPDEDAPGGATFPSRAPDRRIDGVFADPGLSMVSCGYPDVPLRDLRAASDHLPVVVELRPR